MLFDDWFFIIFYVYPCVCVTVYLGKGGMEGGLCDFGVNRYLMVELEVL